MPTYDYLCEKCGHEFEAFQSMSEAPLTDCPECKAKNQVKRLIGCGAGIIFKGSGFYETDYKRQSSPERFSDSKAKTDSTSSTKTESKSTSKTKTNGKAKTNGSAKS